MAQSLSSRVSDIIESGGVLWAKDERGLTQAQALQSAGGVRSQDGLEADFVIGAEAIGRFAVGPIAASLRDRSQRLLHEMAGQKLESVSQTPIVEIRGGKLVKGPQRIRIPRGFDVLEIGESPLVKKRRMRRHPL